MKTLGRRAKESTIEWLALGLCLSTFLFSLFPEVCLAQQVSNRRQEFLKMFARSYYPGRSGQIMVVPREGDFLTRSEPEYRFMHGSPWNYDANIPLIFHGPPFIRPGAYTGAANQQDVVPTLAAMLKLPLPPTVSGRSLKEALNVSAGAPTAILLAVLDGMRLDYLDRYKDVLPTLTRLSRGGAWFRNARVNFLPTVTALAHASIGTGADPGVHGIVLNTPFDVIHGKSQGAYPGKSPQTLMALSLADLWNLHTDGRAVIASQGSSFTAVAGLAGHGGCLLSARPTILATYSDQGGWDTNPDCYRLPEYLKTQRSERLWQAVNGQWMGHDISNPDAVTRSALFPRFEADALVAMIENEPLGASGMTALLLVNLKTPDFVGHQFGPDSPELRETLAEQDRQLAAILRALEKKAGPNRFVVVITADHGMPPEPKAPHKRHFQKEVVDLIHQQFDPDRGALIAQFEASNHQMFVNKERLRELGLTLSRITRFLEAQPFIYAAYTEDEVQKASDHSRSR